MAENLKIIDLPPAHWGRAARCAAKLIAEGKSAETFEPSYWRDPAIRIVNWSGDVTARGVDPDEDYRKSSERAAAVKGEE